MVHETWWREAILLYASKASDASNVIEAALRNRSTTSLALAFALYREKINVDPKLRSALDETVTKALLSRDAANFKPPGEAWLAEQEANAYVRLDGSRELSGWITQAEYQLFLLTQGDADRNYFPIHWANGWFEGQPKDPILGVSAAAAIAYCAWLDNNFPGSEHRLPTSEEILQDNSYSTEPWICWSQSEFAIILAGSEQKRGSYSPAPELEYKRPARELEYKRPAFESRLEVESGLEVFHFALGTMLLMGTVFSTWLAFQAGHWVLGTILAFCIPVSLIVPVLVTGGVKSVAAGLRWVAAGLRWVAAGLTGAPGDERDERLIRNLRSAISGSKLDEVKDAAKAFESQVHWELVRANNPLMGRLLGLIRRMIGRYAAFARKREKLQEQIDAALQPLSAAQKASAPLEVRVRIRRSIDGLIENPLFVQAFKEVQVDQIRVLTTCLNRRERGDEQPFEGIRVVRATR